MVSIIHQNVQSIGNSIDRINEMMKDNLNCKVLCLSEHWKSKTLLKNYVINNFRLISEFCREDGKYGGSAIYVRQDLKSRELVCVTKIAISGVFECSAIECSFGKTGAVIVNVYRPPSGDIRIFLDKIEFLLNKIFIDNKKIFVVGDFNIELLKDNKTKIELLSIMNSFNINQTIFENTRISNRSASCIDNIFTNSDFVKAYVFENFVSDHTAQKIEFGVHLTKESFSKFTRFFSDESKNNFVHSLAEQDWLEVYNIEQSNVNEQWNIFMNVVLVIFNQNFPRKLISRKQCKKPIIDKEILESKSRLDNLLKLSRFDAGYKQQYNEEKKVYDKTLVSVKKKNYQQRIKNSDNKTKCMWAIHKEITGKDYFADIGIEGNSEDIANSYNGFLLSIIPELLNSLIDVPFSCTIETNVKSMFLKPVTPDEIVEIASGIKNKHSSGIDELPTSIVKLAVPTIKTVLSYIINNSFCYGVFPDNLKIALIKPLYKKGNPESLNSYRPISLLPAFSKIFERAMCVRLLSFLNEGNVFSNCQHGFLKNRSTQTAVFEFLTHILNHIEKLLK